MTAPGQADLLRRVGIALDCYASTLGLQTLEEQNLFIRVAKHQERETIEALREGVRLLAQQPAPASDLAEALEGLIRQWDGEYVAAAPNEQEVRFLREHADELREALRAVGHPVSVLQRDLDDAILRRSELTWKVAMSKSSPRWLTPEWQAEVEAADREVERARAALSAAEAPAGRDG